MPHFSPIYWMLIWSMVWGFFFVSMVVFWWEYPYSYKDKYSKRFNWDWALWYTTKMWVWVVHKNHFWPKMNYGIPIMYWFL